MADQTIYAVGGTVQASGGVYIPRDADKELLRLCREGEFAYVLTARQMGKSSLMVRTSESLVDEGTRTVIIDLTEIGSELTATADQWYMGILTTITETVGLQTDVNEWWRGHEELGVTHRMTMFFEKVLLREVKTSVVVFIDEIDSTLSLSFRDDFFAAIRAVYNRRAFKKELHRLSFVLFGVATPDDLVKNPQRTPFNIGHRVELTDFTFIEALPLAEGFGHPRERAEDLLRWALKWTGGHPYLTQRLCRAIAERRHEVETERDVDGLVDEIFLGRQSAQDQNLQFVRRMLTELWPEPAEVLDVYRQIRLGQRPVLDDKQSRLKAHLKLSGLVRRSGDKLVIRNYLYETVFDLRWIRTIFEEKSEGEPAAAAGDGAAPAAEKDAGRAALSSGAVRNVYISSTALDLPEHRKEVMDACLRMGMFPHVLEHLPASGADAAHLALDLVEGADIYVGIFAYRYGYVPEGSDVSLTEMEYARAVERGIPRLIFVMADDHPIMATDLETGRGAAKLKRLKDRLRAQNTVIFFKSSWELRAQVIQSLAQYRESDLTKFHYVSDIPEPPEAFIAHPYTLLQTHRLVGRQPELNLLTDWVAKPDSEVHRARILNVVAVGGMGKSALTWKWFNDIAPQEMKPMVGRMWWSFYESDATFENFVTRALAYVTRRPLAEVQQTPAPERETQLLAALDREPFLLVLDGLERILIAYARMDAAYLSDDDYDKQTANFVANAYGLPASAAQSFTGEHRLRKTADPRAGTFLRKLANVRASRILASTRLYPADLQAETGAPLPGCSAIFLPGLADDDALELWRASGVTGARDSLLPLFQRADNHPLLIQALASEVARDRRAPGDFDAWRRAHPDFDPFSLPLMQVKSHVLAFALRGLDDKAQQVLRTIAAFRMPARYDNLAALLIGEGKPCADERELDGVLTELEDRGLVGWDKRANRYDLHPLVRGVVWGGLGDEARRSVYAGLRTHFEAVPMIDDPLKVNSLEDLTPAIELYNTLIGLGRYDDALIVFRERLDDAMLYRLSASRQRVELLELLFPDGLEQPPRWNRQGDQAYTLNALAQSYHFSGQPGRAAALFRRAITIAVEMKNDRNISVGLYNLSNTLRLAGALRESEAAARRALVITCEQDDRFPEADSLNYLGLTLAARGLADESESALQRALRLFIARSNSQSEGLVNSYLAQRALWRGEFAGALSFADRAWELAHVMSLERDFILAARAQGEAALGLNDLAAADERLHHALTRARMVNLVEEELPALIALTELRRRQRDLKVAREFLDDVWDAAERGPYPLFHADACNVLAQIERDEGNQVEAVEAATKAYRLAWCDGPPFAYHRALIAAQGHLRGLGVPEPEMPPFDESKFEPLAEA